MGITLATFNVKDLFDGVSAAKIEWTARMIVRADADVLALQEVSSEEVVRAVVGPSYAIVLGTADKRGIRCALASRRTILASGVHTAAALEFPLFFEGDAPPFAGRIPLRRGVAHARVDGGAVGPIEVLSAHFKSRRAVPLRTATGAAILAVTPRERAEAEVRSFAWRAAEALYVRGRVDDRLAHDPSAAIVVMGDLNDVPESVTLAILRGEGAGALECCATRVAAGERYSILHDGERAQLDHVLVTPNLFARVSAARFLNDELREHLKVPHEGDLDAPAPPPTIDSDHAPFVVRLG